MIQDEDLAPKTTPVFLSKTESLLEKLRGMSANQLQHMYRCNDKILAENIKRIETMNLHKNLLPALFSYSGLAFQHLSATSLCQDELDYLQEYFRILSGFYGVLKPMDGITPYRLEMLSVFPDGSNLYDYWNDALYHELDDDVIINLASEEYSRCIKEYLQESDRMINIVFGEFKNGKLITKATKAKMARGDMIWYMAQNHITDPEDIKKFSEHYRYAEELSNATHFVFIGQE